MHHLDYWLVPIQSVQPLQRIQLMQPIWNAVSLIWLIERNQNLNTCTYTDVLSLQLQLQLPINIVYQPQTADMWPLTMSQHSLVQGYLLKTVCRPARFGFVTFLQTVYYPDGWGQVSLLRQRGLSKLRPNWFSFQAYKKRSFYTKLYFTIQSGRNIACYLEALAAK